MATTRRRFIAGLSAAPLIAQSPKPHLVLFLSDDHGWHDSSVFGSRTVRTPNLQRIANTGTVFRQAYTGAAICIPSRAIISSGLCSHRNGAIANGRPMKSGVRTLPTYLSGLGYRVAHFGKSHFLPKENYADWEQVPSEIKGATGLDHDLDTQAVDNWLVSRSASDKRPLCLIVCSHSPHVNWAANKDYNPARVDLPASFIDTPETRRARCDYFTDITKMDQQLGEVYTSIRKRLGENAMFLYTSDNGAQWPFGKWNLYDAGIRMPMVASWPGVVKKGSSDAMLHFTDILPTFMELAGGKGPTDIDGRSFAGVLRGSTDHHRTEIFAQHTADDNGHMNCFPMRAIRNQRFKYIWNLRPDLAYRTHIDRAENPSSGRMYWGSWVEKAKTDPRAKEVIRRYHQRPAEELYDTVADPHETRNLASMPEHRGTLADLRGKVKAWMAGMDDKGELFGVPRPLSGESLPI